MIASVPSQGASVERSAQPAPWRTRRLARATGFGAVPIAALGLVAAAPPGTVLPIAFAAGFFALLLAPLWLYAVGSALVRGRAGLLSRLSTCLSMPLVLAIGFLPLAWRGFDGVLFAFVRGSLDAVAAEAAALPVDRAIVDVRRIGPLPVSGARLYGIDGSIVRVELSGTHSRTRASGYVKADEAGLAQLRRIDPDFESWPLGGDWHGYRAALLEASRR